MNHCIILYDRVFERFQAFSHLGLPSATRDDYYTLQEAVKSWGYTEVPINSKPGQKILAKIGVQR